MSSTLTQLLYLISAIFFILGLQGLSSAATSKRGNTMAILGMALTIITTLMAPKVTMASMALIAIGVGAIIGISIAKRIAMTALPQLVAGFHSLVGLAAVCVGIAAFYSPQLFGIADGTKINPLNLTELTLGIIVGAITFSGSVIAFLKLNGSLKSFPIRFNQRRYNIAFAIMISTLFLLFFLSQEGLFFWALITLALIFGMILIVPIGGADMPVVVSMLNSYSGWAAAGIGFTLSNHVLIISGALVGASGAILSYIMCKGMNRNLIEVIFGADQGTLTLNTNSNQGQEKPHKVSCADDAAYFMNQAQSVIIVPGYGMAVAHAQHALHEMVTLLKENKVKVRFAIHPVAGRMPGHMNVLLAEADIPYDDVLELEEINNDFASTDVVFVIGANDITNPAAKTDPQSPIYGMPILEVEKARTIFFVKRTMATGYAGVDNELFYKDQTMMLLGDAKKVCEQIIKSLKEAA